MINILLSLLIGYVPVASPGKQLVDAVYSSDSANVNLVVPVWIDKKPERLLITKTVFSGYMTRINRKYENTDSIKKELSDILSGKKKCFFSTATAYVLGVSDYRLLHWDNPYLLKQDTATKSRFLHEMLLEYSDAGSFFILNKQYENDDYVVEALFKYHFLVYTKNGRKLVKRAGNSGIVEKVPLVANADSIELMAKAVYNNSYRIHNCYLAIPAIIQGEPVRLVITKIDFEDHIHAFNPAFTSRDSLQKELADLLSGRKKWVLDDSKEALNLITHSFVLRGKNTYLANGSNLTNILKRIALDYNEVDRGFTMRGDFNINADLTEMLFLNHFLVSFYDGGVSLIRAKSMIK
ncbi:hypothetical protein SAMN05421788_103117 [Filimonas lacunae]|uniref:Uncharacterized protein n=1 Tax=Filimonas lacunae TaxID=477680 RepID=A0A173MJV9_9BACT|nr:hypothetical protein [Filimonas lacunae]BAV07767.1 hypothetical protein FLA_3798 [Filimonas lacunae]SIT04523.1 hypothetical protein SAMN05421788_103117 [Filimonas lacunae]